MFLFVITVAQDPSQEVGSGLSPAGDATMQVGTGAKLSDANAFPFADQLGGAGAPPQAPATDPFEPFKENLPPVGNQGWQYSCVAWAAGYAVKTYHERVQRGWDQTLKEHQLSPAYVYNSVNPSKGAARCTETVSYSTVLEFIRDNGTLPMSDYEYRSTGTEGDCRPRALTEKNRQKASDFRLGRIYQLRQDSRVLDQIKQRIVGGYPVMVLVRIDESFGDPSGPNPITALPKSTSPELYHAMVAVGFSSVNGTIRLLNSFGDEWRRRPPIPGGYVDIDMSVFQSILREAFIAEDAVESDPAWDSIIKLEIVRRDGEIHSAEALIRDKGALSRLKITRVVLRIVRDGVEEGEPIKWQNLNAKKIFKNIKILQDNRTSIFADFLSKDELLSSVLLAPSEVEEEE